MAEFTKEQIAAAKELQKAISDAKACGLVLVSCPDQIIAYTIDDYNKAVEFLKGNDMDLNGVEYSLKKSVLKRKFTVPMLVCGDIISNRRAFGKIKYIRTQKK